MLKYTPLDKETALKSQLYSWWGSSQMALEPIQKLADIMATYGELVLAIGSVIGLLAGCAIGISSRVWECVEGPVDFFRSLPAFALFPFFIMIFGPGDQAKVATAAWFIVFIMLIASAYAVRDANTTRLKAARVLGATRLQTFLYVLVPQGVPQLMLGFRTALAFAPIVVIATEMFSGTRHGLGDRIYEARLVYKVSEMYATLIVAGLLGFALEQRRPGADGPRCHPL